MMKRKYVTFKLFGMALGVGFRVSTIRYIDSRNGRFYIPFGILYQSDGIEGLPVCHCLNFVFLFLSIDFGIIK